MADDQMRMKAQLINEVSGPVKQMQRDMQSFVKSTKDLQTVFNKYGKDVFNTGKNVKDYTKQAGLMRREFEQLKDIIKRANPAVAELSGQFGKLNMGAGTLIGTLAAVGVVMYEGIKKTAEFAEKMRALKFASRETGLASAQLKQLSLAAEQFGLNSEQMTESMYGFADAMTRIHQMDAGFINSIRPAARYTQELLKMGFEGKGTAEELEALFRAMDKIKQEHPGVVGQQLSRSFAQMFGVKPEMARLSLDEFHKLMGQMKELGFDPFKLKQAEADAKLFNDELLKTKVIIDTWGTAIEAKMLKPLTEAVRLLNTLMMGKATPDVVNKNIADAFAPFLGGHIVNKPSDVPDSAPIKPLPPRRPWSAQGLPKFADGAIVTQPTIAQIGEKGPEAVIPLTGGGFDPFVQMQMMIEEVFGKKGGGGYALVAGGGGGGGGSSRSKMAALAGMGIDVGKLGGSGTIGGGSIKQGALGKTFSDDASRGALFRKGIGPRADALKAMQAEGNPFLAQQRSRFAEELKANPQTRQELAALTTLEGNPANVTEALMNRMAYTHGSISKGMHSGFYGPINRGQLPSAMAALDRNPKKRAQVDAAIDSVLAGRNVLKGATDQGMASDPNGRWLGGRVYGQDQVYNDWGGGPGGHAGAARFREEQQRQAADAEATRRAAMDRAAVDRTTVNGAIGPSSQKIEGNADLNVKVTAPPGTSVSASSGGIFQRPNIERNIQMAPAAGGPAQGISGFDQPM